VAGRCQAQKGTPAILETTDAGTPAVKRVVFHPVDVAYLAPDVPPPEGSVPSIVALGKDESARLFLRFEARIPENAKVVEAYLLLPRAQTSRAGAPDGKELAADSDPVPISVHVLRVIDPWDSRTIRWSIQPRTQDTGSPAAVVTSSGHAQVRIDVRDLVSRWPRREKDDQGLAVVASTTGVTGIAVSLGADVTLEAYLKE
jgi:hypothetical protein